MKKKKKKVFSKTLKSYESKDVAQAEDMNNNIYE